MKKLFTTIFLALLALTASAQENPNRIVVQPKYKAAQGFLSERIDSIYFVNIEGRVAADPRVMGYSKGRSGDTIRLAVTKTPDCASYKIAVMTTAQAKSFVSDAAMEQYFDNLPNCPSYTDDYTSAMMTGFETAFKPKTSYSVVTLGYDRYGIACASAHSDFTTPDEDVVGNPSVVCTVVDTNQGGFSIYFGPNDDCYGYYVCAFEAGTADEVFEKWSAEEGFASMEEMIKTWGGDMLTEPGIHQWTQMKPGTDYEVYVLPVDINEADGQMLIVPVSTTEYGGDGEATVTITIGEFGQIGASYYQYVTFTPNDQATVMRDLVISKNDFDYSGYWGDGDDGYIASYLMSDDMPDYWNRYAEDVSQWGVYANTDYVAFAVACNAQGEWGPLAKVEFRTGKGSDLTSVKPANVGKRLEKPADLNDLFAPGKVPSVQPKGKRHTGITLTEEK